MDNLSPANATHPRVVAVINGKGGVGKSSITANLSAQLAAINNLRILLVGLDPQDNLGEDLGYANIDAGDDGKALVRAIDQQIVAIPEGTRQVRSGIDVLPGGDELEYMVKQMHVDEANGLQRSWDLATALGTVQDSYDLVLIDCPPGYHTLQELALTAAQWMLVPTVTDGSSLKGIARLAQRVMTVNELGADPNLLGVVLFNLPTSATRVRRGTYDRLYGDLGPDAPIFEAHVRSSMAAAHDARERGQLMHELARDVEAAPPWWKQRQQNAQAAEGGELPPPSPALSRAAAGVARDYEVLAMEFMRALEAAEGGAR